MRKSQALDKEKLWNKNLVLIMLANCCSSLGFQILMPTLPIYIQQRGYTQAIIGMIVGILTLTTILFRPFIGQAIDTWSRKKLFIIGMVIISLSIFSYQFSYSVVSLTALRLIHGVGWGIVTGAAGTIATDFIPKQRIGEGMAYYGLSTVFSMAIAPAIGLNIIAMWGFPELFTITTCLTIIGIFFGTLINYQGVTFDNETHVSKALFEKSAFKPSLINFFVSLTFSSITTFITLYAAEVHIKEIGIFFTVLALTLIIIRPITGYLVDRKGFDFVIVPGIIFIGTAILILVLAKSLLFFLITAVMYGIGLGAIQPSLQVKVVYDIPPRRRGAANSTFLLSSDLAFGAGAMIWGVVAGLVGYSTMYVFVLIPVFLAVIVHLFVMDSTKEQ